MRHSENSSLKKLLTIILSLQQESYNIQDSHLLKNNQDLENENDLLSDDYENNDESELIDDANDEALIRLAQANIGEDSDLDNDILFGEELTASSDPVISGVASILSKCFTLKGSDIHAEPLEDRLRIRYRVDGVLKRSFCLPKSCKSNN